MFRLIIFSLLIFLLTNCEEKTAISVEDPPTPKGTFLVVLGIAQDAGFPQAACQKECCEIVWKHRHERRMVSCIAIVDAETNQAWMFDATPDFKDQLFHIENIISEANTNLTGIFLTHAHIGHYTGLMHLGREVMGTKQVPVYAMPRMKSFLENNGPWSQLVTLKNIDLKPLQNDSTIILNERIMVTPLQVPHRDEFSETVGYRIEGNHKSALFIPDIDKWQLWERNIVEEIRQVDYALLDGSFYQNGEIPGRNMSEIPHPFLVESMELFKDLSVEDKAKVQFIHFNHTNPILHKNSDARKHIIREGFGITEDGQIFEM